MKPLGLPIVELLLEEVRDEEGGALAAVEIDEDAGLDVDLAATSMSSRSLRCKELLRWRIIGTASVDDAVVSTLSLALGCKLLPAPVSGAGAAAKRWNSSSAEATSCSILKLLERKP